MKFKKPDNKDKCLILGCGPSLLEINKEKVKELSKEYIVVTIKQSYYEYGDFSDFQFFNCNNVVKYERKKAKFICCSPSAVSSGRWKGQEIDQFYHISNTSKKLKDFENVEDFFQEENIGKHIGAGIMFEITLPFIYNLGVKEIITAGWDYHKNEQEIAHFYKEFERSKFVNPAALPYAGENKESIENSRRVKEFFESKGIKLSCVKSEKCFLDKSIERIEL